MDNIIYLDKYRNKHVDATPTEKVWAHLMHAYDYASLDCVQAAMTAADDALREGADLVEAIRIAEVVMDEYRAA